MAEAIGATRQAVSLWESGARTPRGRLFDAYAEAIATLRNVA